MAKRPGGEMVGGGSVPSWSQMLPLQSKWRSLGSKGFFIPVLALLAMTLFIPSSLKLAWAAAIIISGGTLFFVYRLCGKQKSWLAVFGAAAFTFLVVTYGMAPFDFVFEGILPGNVGDPNTWGQYRFGQLALKLFFAAGLREELVKIVPVLLLLWMTSRFKSSSQREAIGVSEPLDGIVLAAASAVGFALSETMLGYVPRSMLSIYNKSHGDLALAQIQGLTLTVDRLIADVCGHVAYSGYFGYMVGLAAMKPKSRWKILGFGYLLSATLHTLWDATDGTNGLLIIGLLSYAALATAIFKAREISPNRELLQPSLILGARGRGSVAASPATNAMVAHAAAGAPVAKAAPPILEAEYLPLNPPVKEMPVAGASPQLPSGSLSLKFGSRHVVIVPGLKLLSHQIPGLRPQTEGGPVAEITKNPQDPTVLGLRNLSASTWQVLTANGMRKELQPGQAIRLSSGTRISFGAVDGEVA